MGCDAHRTPAVISKRPALQRSVIRAMAMATASAGCDAACQLRSPRDGARDGRRRLGRHPGPRHAHASQPRSSSNPAQWQRRRQRVNVSASTERGGSFPPGLAIRDGKDADARDARAVLRLIVGCWTGGGVGIGLLGGWALGWAGLRPNPTGTAGGATSTQ